MENDPIGDFRPRNWANQLFFPSINRTHRWMQFAFIFGSITHLWLGDAWTEDWVLGNLFFVVGLIFLTLNASLLGWLFSAIGCAIPLLFHRDQLTQSVLLLSISSTGLLFQSLSLYLKNRRDHYELKFLRTVSYFGIIAYFFAALHKLNSGFLNPKFSCAVYGFDKVERYFSFHTSIFDPYLAHIVLIVELGIPLLYLLKKKNAARFLAIAFHIPLTLTMAPAFVFVMMICHVAFISEEEWKIFVDLFRTYRFKLLVSAFIVTILSLLLHRSLPEWTMIPREFFLWFLLFITALSLGKGTPQTQSVAPSYLILFLFSLNCFSPYLGFQYQHSAAMLSNLRIDEGCWNSSIFPESIRLSDDYVRVNTAYFVKPGRIKEYETIVLDQLWSPPQIRQMRRNWCSKSIRPFYMKGTYRSEEFIIKDVCDLEETWPFIEDGFLGIELFPHALRFQKNLEKKCPQACVH